MSHCMSLKRTLTLTSALAGLTIAGTVPAVSQSNTASSNGAYGLGWQVVDTIDTQGSGAIVVDQSLGKVYVAGGPGLVVIDENTDQVINNIPLTSGAFSGLAIDQAYGKIFTTNLSSPVVLSVVDTNSDSVVATVPMPGSGQIGSLGVAVDPKLQKVFVAVEATQNYIAVVDEITNTIIDTINLDQFPQQVAVDPVRHNVYVAAAPAGPYEIYVINGRTDEITATIPTPESVEVGLAIDPIRGLLYASGTGADNNSNVNAPGAVYVIDESTNTITDTIFTAPSAGADNFNVINEMVAVDPFNNTGFVADFHYGTVSIFNTATNRLQSTITIAGGKNFGMAVDSKLGKAYVSDVIHNNVDVIARQSANSVASQQ
jgi:DNA-binding beta-propeller fold protein YncE